MLATAVAPRRIQGLVVAAVVLAAVLGAGIAVASSWPSPVRTSTAVFAYDDVPQGVTLVDVGGYAAYLVRSGDEIAALSPMAGRDEPVIWCPNLAAFVGALPWSTFRAPARLGGASASALATFAVVRRTEGIFVDADRRFGGSRIETERLAAMASAGPDPCAAG